MFRRIWLGRSALRAPLRRYTDSALPLTSHRAKLFIDALPTSHHYWQVLTLQKYAEIFLQDDIIANLRARLANITAYGFSVVDMTPHNKEGGIFVTFEYRATDKEAALKAIEKEIEAETFKHGGLPSWMPGFRRARAWLVKGEPWIEDMWRLPTQFLNIHFDGPDVDEERIYHLLRPYGPIVNIMQPETFPAGTRRYMTAIFREGRDAVNARNALHGIRVESSTSSASTTLHMLYTPRHIWGDRPSVIDWLSKHPRISLPLFFFILGGISYAIFDPIRSIMIKAKMQDWFVIQEYGIYRWLREKSRALRIIEPEPEHKTEDVWKEREEAKKATRAYIADWPTTVAFVHGPQGSGKSSLMNAVLSENKRTVLTIDCRELQDATSDVQVIDILARQVGYWPVFSFLNSINQIVDMVTVGIMGQKANISSSNSLPEQLRSMLLIVRSAIKSVGGSHKRDAERHAQRAAQKEELAQANARRMERIQRGAWHDGRLDCVAGNGVMAELGVGDEAFDDPDDLEVVHRKEVEKRTPYPKGKAELQALYSLPVVVIKHFEGGSRREEIFDVLAEWAASLAELQLAHVIVVSDNRENGKRLAKALPSKPLQTITLSDADAPSALAFVKRKLEDAHISLKYTHEQVTSVQKLGGRASDLDSLVYKVRNGATVPEAVEDIIARGVNELQKNAFADDAEEAKQLPWTREQAWTLFKLLSKQSEINYHEALLEFPFKGDEAPLRSLEHAEIIAIEFPTGRPSTIKPGRPVYTYVFQRLVNDPIFRATQDIAFNEKLILSQESTIKACEQELLALKEIDVQGHWLWGGGNTGAAVRMRYLSSKMRAASMKIDAAERQNVEMKKVLMKGG
ncbi:hypothetical protein MIND_01192000 [Mycena indigotica]|uniref:Mitochondrial escape protein 2 n=1 Tax=Mycena indigotica TaxID=2126181 RepID=A0A8H6VYM0_9AGAR|nr:uncharacterized protein MIND_01192000 [Mycena indigotica]KAF7292929.1 hypothetical protein MIND_01192000 [Mycena indigotica]